MEQLIFLKKNSYCLFVLLVLFIYLVIFYTNAIFGSPQLLITLHKPGLHVLCFARAFLPLYIRILPIVIL